MWDTRRLVPRVTIFGEWEARGEVCCMPPVINDVELRNLSAICALLQRMGFGRVWVWNIVTDGRAFSPRVLCGLGFDEDNQRCIA